MPVGSVIFQRPFQDTPGGGLAAQRVAGSRTSVCGMRDRIDVMQVCAPTSAAPG
jgi:hypothetical protein